MHCLSAVANLALLCDIIAGVDHHSIMKSLENFRAFNKCGPRRHIGLPARQVLLQEQRLYPTAAECFDGG